MIPLLTAIIGIPPSVNHRLNGAWHKKPHVIRYQHEVELRLNTQQSTQNIEAIQEARETASTFYVSLHASLTASDMQIRDIDNMAKVVLDTVLNAYLGLDDHRVTDLHLSKREVQADSKPSLLVSVYEREDMEYEVFAPVFPHSVEALGPTVSTRSKKTARKSSVARTPGTPRTGSTRASNAGRKRAS